MKRRALLSFLVLAMTTAAWGDLIGYAYTCSGLTGQQWSSWCNYPDSCQTGHQSPNHCPDQNPCPDQSPCPHSNPCQHSWPLPWPDHDGCRSWTWTTTWGDHCCTMSYTHDGCNVSMQCSLQ